jgi:hypothetical protein
VVVGAFDVALTLLGTAVEGLRTEGRLGHLPRLLLLQASMAARIASWDVAITSAEECRRLAHELGEPQWVAAAETVDSIIAGTRGDEEAAERAAAAAERVAVPAGRTSRSRLHRQAVYSQPLERGATRTHSRRLSGCSTRQALPTTR